MARIAGWPFPIRRTLRSRRGSKRYLELASGLSAPDRPRDFDDVIQLIRANRLGEHLADSLHPYVQSKYRELWGYAQRPTELQ